MTDYFLKIDGITGDSVQRDFEGWFTISAFAWSVDGSGAASPDALPLDVDTLAFKGVPLVEAKAAAASPLPRVEFQAYESAGRAGGGWSLRIVLTNARVLSSGIELSGSGHLVTRWSLWDYTQADVSSRTRDARGNWLPATTATWRA